ncbi:MAG: T9SS type A sorting domain-containing protein [Bacteroidales bacterium]|nr:T9SS type A sorting domain-containing protein [Bacteroidales bacterium]
MKKNLLIIFSFLLVTSIANSQITIASENLPEQGVIVYLAQDSLPDASIQPGAAGTDLTWDFSALVVKSQDTMTFVNPSASPHDAAFSTDNLAALMEGDMWAYFNKSSSVFETVGVVGDVFGVGIPLTIAFEPAEKLMVFPFTYPETFTGTTGFEVIVDTIKAEQTANYSVVCDAWGTIITPSGTFQAIRTYKTKIETTVIYLLYGSFWVPVNTTTDTTYTYDWWSNNSSAKFPVVSFEWLPSEGVIDGDVEFLQNTILGFEKPVANNQINVFPNPSNGEIFIDAPINSTVEIFNPQGKLVYSQNNVSGNTEISFESNCKGLFLVRIISDNNLTFKKVLVQ